MDFKTINYQIILEIFSVLQRHPTEVFRNIVVPQGAPCVLTVNWHDSFSLWVTCND